MASHSQLLRPDSKIIIVGAGVFGLSTTLHLSKRGYKDIHIFDRQPFDKNHYEEDQGANGASCDHNKIVRASYGGEQLYQDLAFKAMPEWQKWNEELARSEEGDLPETLRGVEKLWENCGFLRLVDSEGLDEKEKQTQENFPVEKRGTQFRISDGKRREEALREGIPGGKLDPFERVGRGLTTDGVLDMTAGFVLASRACAWALHLVRRSPFVTTHLGPEHALQSLNTDPSNPARYTGITTLSGQKHKADLILLATGGWTPSLLPPVSHLLETTSGSVLSIHLPPHLRSKFSPENFPVWSWNMSSYKPGRTVGGLYGLPATPEGTMKFGFRGAKWTHYPNDSKISIPDTGRDKIPAEAMRVIKAFCAENMPELLGLDLASCRLCWYTDSIDNSWLIDFVPEKENLIVASGGSGHGFKFLPVLGEHIVDVIERKDTAYTKLFKWRDVPHGKRNGLEEGPDGWRNLDRQRFVGNEEWRGKEKSKL